MWISLYTFLEIVLFLSVTIYDTTQNFLTILTVWTKIVQTARTEDIYLSSLLSVWRTHQKCGKSVLSCFFTVSSVMSCPHRVVHTIILRPSFNLPLINLIFLSFCQYVCFKYKRNTEIRWTFLWLYVVSFDKVQNNLDLDNDWQSIVVKKVTLLVYWRYKVGYISR